MLLNLKTSIQKSVPRLFPSCAPAFLCIASLTGRPCLELTEPLYLFSLRLYGSSAPNNPKTLIVYI